MKKAVIKLVNANDHWLYGYMNKSHQQRQSGDLSKERGFRAGRRPGESLQ